MYQVCSNLEDTKNIQEKAVMVMTEKVKNVDEGFEIKILQKISKLLQ